MSYVFDHDDEVIWSPSLRVGQLYVGLAQEMSGFLGLPHGLKAMANDYYELDSERFRDFVAAVVREFSGHPVSGALVHGFCATSFVLLARMKQDVSEVPDWLTEETVRTLSRRMPR
jgi:hypothetical protein